MTISATETTLTLTGDESPIASLDIDGNLVDFTAYDGTLASVTAGTPYTLTLSGFAVQDDAFSPTSTFQFTVEDDTNIDYKRSGRGLWRESLQVGKTNTYTLTLTDWLDGGDIDIADVQSDDTKVTVNTLGYDNTQDAIGVSLTGVSAGRHAVHFTWETALGRSGCFTGYVDVLDC